MGRDGLPLRLASPMVHADNGQVFAGASNHWKPCRPARSLHRGAYMRSIIRQNLVPLALPDFRNLGTILRILVAANGLAAVAALVQEPRWALWLTEWFANVAVLEPPLLLQLAVLYALQPWLARQPYGAGACAVAAIAVVAEISIYALVGPIATSSPGSLLRNLALALILCGTLLFYFRLRAKALSPAFTEARLQALQARIRPHFLFNSITAVLSLVRSDPRRAETALEDLADLFRVLMRDNRELTPLADEVELCRQYLALEKLRLGDRLQVDWHITSMPGDALVPPLVLQPLIENAVYHGIEPSSSQGMVSINIFYKGGDVHAILRNPYRADGGSHHGGNKMAIDNVRERLALHFDAEGSLESKVVADAYEVHLRMPYRPAKPAAGAHVDPARSVEAKAVGGGSAPVRGAGAHGGRPLLATGRREAPHG
jgi:two-component system, LytTR family, sensor histidine kinase AlgZ